MRIEMLKSKIHRATITDKNVNYEGSLSLDPNLMNAAGIYAFEKVQVVNVNNGSRLETYAIPGQIGSGEVVLNGAAARWGEVGDLVIVITYAHVEQSEIANFEPRVVLVNEKNQITQQLSKTQ